MSSRSRSGASHPCGCGGASQASACSCGCGTADCHEGAYVRPRFFAGQLLTEEDLQSLADYMTAKDRLHNRHFFGEGVVCGFAVTCHPCDGGKVTVHPGHALDCCGNDVVLSCVKTLDVNAMVHDLRQRLLGGYDCGDPCADRKALGSGGPGIGGAATAAAGDQTGGPKGQPPPAASHPESRHYCLYVRYCEELAEPVSRYATDEPCGAQGCEPTRVREGLRFELRCREERRPPAQLADRLRECLGDAARAEKIAVDAQEVDRIAWRALQEIGKEPLNAARPIEPAELAEIADSAAAAIQTAEGDPSPANIDRALDVSVALAGRLDRLFRLEETQATDLMKEFPSFSTKVQEGLATLTRVQPIAKFPSVSELARRHVRTALSRIEGQPLSSQVWRVKDPGGRAGVGHATLWTDESIPTLNGGFEDKACKLREELLDWLDRSPDLADCALRREVQSIDVCREPGRSPAIEDPAYLAASRKLAIASLRRWQECFCRALIPPCPACEDPGVLLACLEVRDCDVVRICNLERTFVLTPTALRYWLPLHQYEQALERLCCRRLEPAEPTHGTAEQEYDVVPFNLREQFSRGLPGLEARYFLRAIDAIGGQETRHAVETAPVLESMAPPPAVQPHLDEIQKLVKQTAELERRLKAVEKRKKS